MRTSQKQVKVLLREARQALNVRTNHDAWLAVRERVQSIRAELDRRGWGAIMISPYADWSWTMRAYRHIDGCGMRECVIYLTAEQLVRGDLVELFCAANGPLNPIAADAIPQIA
jgi:hypothetical protein